MSSLKTYQDNGQHIITLIPLELNGAHKGANIKYTSCGGLGAAIQPLYQTQYTIKSIIINFIS